MLKKYLTIFDPSEMSHNFYYFYSKLLGALFKANARTTVLELTKELDVATGTITYHLAELITWT